MLGKTVNLNMNYNALTTMYERDIRIYIVVTSHGAGKVTYYEKEIKQKLKLYFSQKYHTLYGNIIHCITMVHVNVNIFVQNSPSGPQQRKRNRTRK